MEDLHGGEFLGAGTYGCAFSPPLARAHSIELEQHRKRRRESSLSKQQKSTAVKSTRNAVASRDAPDDKPRIGKVMLKEDAKNEYMFSERFLHIDPMQKYGIYIDRAPEAILNDGQEVMKSAGGPSEIAACVLASPRVGTKLREIVKSRAHTRSSKQQGSKQLMQLEMQRASSDLSHALKQDAARALFSFSRYESDSTKKKRLRTLCLAHLHAFGSLLQGIYVYHSHKLTHTDIKTPNIVVLRTEKHTKLTIEYRFIDFGLSTTQKATVEDARVDGVEPPSGVLEQTYLAFPLLANVLFARKDHSSTEFEFERGTRDANTAWLREKWKEREDGLGTYVLWLPRYDAVESLHSDYDSLCATYNADPRKPADVRWAAVRATDVFALALVLARIVFMFTGKIFSESRRNKLRSLRVEPASPRAITARDDELQLELGKVLQREIAQDEMKKNNKQQRRSSINATSTRTTARKPAVKRRLSKAPSAFKDEELDPFAEFVGDMLHFRIDDSKQLYRRYFSIVDALQL